MPSVRVTSNLSLYTMLIRGKLEHPVPFWALHSICKPWLSWGVQLPASQALLIKTCFRMRTRGCFSSEEALHECLPANNPDLSFTTAHTNQPWQSLGCHLLVLLPTKLSSTSSAEFYDLSLRLYLRIFPFLLRTLITQPGLQPQLKMLHQ